MRKADQKKMMEMVPPHKRSGYLPPRNTLRRQMRDLIQRVLDADLSPSAHLRVEISAWGVKAKKAGIIPEGALSIEYIKYKALLERDRLRDLKREEESKKRFAEFQQEIEAVLAAARNGEKVPMTVWGTRFFEVDPEIFPTIKEEA